MTMNQTQLENYILNRLYGARFLQEDQAIDLHIILNEQGYDENNFWKIINRMSHDGLIRAYSMGGFYQITSFGVIHAEKNKLISDELINQNQVARTLILDSLAKVYEEEGDMSVTYYENIAEEADLDMRVRQDNLLLLNDLGYVKAVTNGCFSITYKGLDSVREWRKRRTIAEEFDSVSQMTPQPRGRALQRLLAKVMEQHGWSQEEGVRTSNEEMDIIVFREREYYLFECKWEKNPIEASVIRELLGKLNNRVDVRGAVISMSGFTEGAVKQAHDYIGQRIIMLFGPDDVGSMVKGKKTFDELLNTKYKAMVTRKEIVFN